MNRKPSDLLLKDADLGRVIEMAWEDRTPFEAIAAHYGLAEKEVIALMRRSLKPRSFRLWRARVTARATKHVQRRGFEIGRFRCATQKNR